MLRRTTAATMRLAAESDEQLRLLTPKAEATQARAETAAAGTETAASEIEARDAAARRDLTEDERKEKRPDVDRANVVFADSGSETRNEILISKEGDRYVKVDGNKFSASNGKDHAKIIAKLLQR